MSAPVWLSLLTLAVTSAVALTIAAMHRKQMRQIELHRVDPSVPLAPPPNAFTKFLQRNFRHIYLAVNVVLNIAFLTEHLRSTTLLTKAEVFAIAFFTNGLFLSFVFYVLLGEVDWWHEQIDRLYDTIVRLAKSLVERIDEDEPPKKR